MADCCFVCIFHMMWIFCSCLKGWNRGILAQGGQEAAGCCVCLLPVPHHAWDLTCQTLPLTFRAFSPCVPFTDPHPPGEAKTLSMNCRLELVRKGPVGVCREAARSIPTMK